ncbi:GntR family transcriptional regulator [Jannaschia donghaensis]|uniref:Putative HTH-type transcriptional regulator YdfH n=1 Tax=Jannaschia donghaensis TaxID=420998 RepID=A0A0M6YFW1_9RHOB|nr:GntR family transcriptional regulator [Jannaschia donghaensis]CTQ49248.1 putative HTH-type transcriptional regulator YdfH [Jannaschia donghaensis]
MSDSSGLAPLPSGPTSMTDRVFDTLYDAVISLRLPPGARVSESEIAGQLGVSRQPVRDAFFRLSNLGLLAIRPQRPTLITRISGRAVRDAVFVRTALETDCLRVVIETGADGGVARLTDLLDRQRAALAGPDATSFHRLDEAFHEAICDIAGHGHVWAIIRGQKAHMDRIRFLTLSEARRGQVLTEHAGIVDSIANGQTEQGQMRLRDHIRGVVTVLPTLRAKVPEYFTDAPG